MKTTYETVKITPEMMQNAVKFGDEYIITIPATTTVEIDLSAILADIAVQNGTWFEFIGFLVIVGGLFATLAFAPVLVWKVVRGIAHRTK